MEENGKILLLSSWIKTRWLLIKTISIMKNLSREELEKMMEQVVLSYTMEEIRWQLGQLRFNLD